VTESRSNSGLWIALGVVFWLSMTNGIVPTLPRFRSGARRSLGACGVGCWLVLVSAVGCGAAVRGGGTTATGTPLTVTLGASSVVVGQDGVSSTVPLAMSRPTGAPTVTFTGLPRGVTAQYNSTNGVIQVAGSASAAAGTTSVMVLVSQGGQSASQTLSVVSAPVVAVSGDTGYFEGRGWNVDSCHGNELSAGGVE
jgi:hypothetical protein